MKIIEENECGITGDILMVREKRLEKGITETKKIKSVYKMVKNYKQNQAGLFLKYKIHQPSF